jgi:hypothetical protein
MKLLIEQGELNSDLDADFHDLLNVNEMIPAPINVVIEGDPRLADARHPLLGSVINESVADDAAIVQSKLNLNGGIPAGWLGTTAGKAAQGDLAEYVAHKSQPNGYASLNSSGKVPVAELPLGAGAGTITSIGITMPAQFNVTGSPVTSAGVITIAWVNVPDGSWFGNSSGSSAAPVFSTSPIPVSLVPGLDAAKIVSGSLDPARLPLAVGVGVSHAAGTVPDPGATGSAFDYLARDMTFKPIPVFGPGYQPKVSDPLLTINTGPEPYIVEIHSLVDGASLFYSIDSSSGGFQPIEDGSQIQLFSGHVVYAYGALAGYTNSNIVNMPAPSVPPTEAVVTGDPGNPSEFVLGDDSAVVTVGP